MQEEKVKKLENFVIANRYYFFHLVEKALEESVSLEDFLFLCSGMYNTCPYLKIKEALEKDENINSL